MRALGCATLALLGGCSSERVLDPVPIRGRLNLPSAAARAGVPDATWTDASGARLHVESGPLTTVSVEEELRFLVEASAFNRPIVVGGEP